MVLSVMFLPTFVAISREVISAVPSEILEASFSLGATRWQVIKDVVLPTAKIGLFGATFLALARATGETVAVALVAGGVADAQFHLLYPGTSIAAWIATQFGEAQGGEISALMALGVLLMLINFSLSLVSRSLVNRQRKVLARV
jgi:phosphate transport system permease protein